MGRKGGASAINEQGKRKATDPTNLTAKGNRPRGIGPSADRARREACGQGRRTRNQCRQGMQPVKVARWTLVTMDAIQKQAGHENGKSSGARTSTGSLTAPRGTSSFCASAVTEIAVSFAGTGRYAGCESRAAIFFAGFAGSCHAYVPTSEFAYAQGFIFGAGGVT